MPKSMKHPARPPVTATKAQKEALRWLIAHGKTREVRGGDFVDYYNERSGRDHATTSRRHAWRRTGGRVLAAMSERGLVSRMGSSWGTSLYAITDEGRAAAEEVAT